MHSSKRCYKPNPYQKPVLAATTTSLFFVGSYSTLLSSPAFVALTSSSVQKLMCTELIPLSSASFLHGSRGVSRFRAGRASRVSVHIGTRRKTGRARTVHGNSGTHAKRKTTERRGGSASYAARCCVDTHDAMAA